MTTSASNPTEKLQELLKSSVDVIAFEVSRIPEGLDKVDVSRRLKPILSRLAAKDEVSIEAHLSRFQEMFGKRFGLKSEDIKAYRSFIKGLKKKGSGSGDEAASGPDYEWKDHPVLTPAQCEINGIFVFTVYIPQRVEGVIRRTPHLITSERKMVTFSRQELQRHGFRLKDENQIPTDVGRWSLGEDIPNSVSAFLDGKAQVKPTALFDEIRAFLATYIEFPDERYYDYLALYCMGTYVFTIFDSYPYALFLATKRAGKTRTMEVMVHICFNAKMASSISDAAIFRLVESDRPTLFLDEAEKLTGSAKNDVREWKEIINSGYKGSGSAWRCEGDDHTPREYSTYCPKVIGNTEGVNEITADRAVTLKMLRAKRRIPKLITRQLQPTFQKLRNDLYVFAMQYHGKIAEIYREQGEYQGLRDREDELWGPVLVLAELLDEHRAAENPGIAARELLLPRMLGFAHDCRERKLEDEEEENADIRILTGIIDFIQDQEVEPRKDASGTPTDFYSSDELLEYLKGREGLDWVTKRVVSKSLTKLQILRDKRHDKMFTRVAEDGPSSKRRQVVFYRLERARIADIAVRYGQGDKVAGLVGNNLGQQDGQQVGQQTEHVDNEALDDKLDFECWPAGHELEEGVSSENT